MKKFYIMALMALCAVCVAGCSDNDEAVAPAAGLVITANKAEFKAVGGTAQIEVESDHAVKAVSEAPGWCTVSVNGKTIEVTATPNFDIESRSTMVNISDENGSVRVPVYQLGDIFTCKLSDKTLSADGGTFSFPISTMRMDEVSVANLPEWISYSIKEGVIEFQVASVGEGEVDRSAEVSVLLGDKVMTTATFAQFGVPLEGTYTYICKELDGSQKTGTTTLSLNDDGTYTLAQLPYRESSPTYKAVLDCTMNGLERKLSMKAGQFLENWSAGVYLYLIASELSNKPASDVLQPPFSVTNDATATYVATAEYDENNKLKLAFTDGGTWAEHEVSGFGYMLLWGEDIYEYGVVYDLVLVRQ